MQTSQRRRTMAVAIALWGGAIAAYGCNLLFDNSAELVDVDGSVAPSDDASLQDAPIPNEASVEPDAGCAVHVRTDGPEDGDGSEQRPFRTIDAALKLRGTCD